MANGRKRVIMRMMSLTMAFMLLFNFAGMSPTLFNAEQGELPISTREISNQGEYID